MNIVVAYKRFTCGERPCGADFVPGHKPYKNRMHDTGFTLVELLFVVAILVSLVLLAIPNFNSLKNRAKVSRSMTEMRQLETDVTAYAIEKGFFPNSLADVGRGGFVDPWGRPYQYLNIVSGGGSPRQDMMFQNYNGDFDLYSMGPDGASAQEFSDLTSKDDIIRSGDGAYTGKRSF
jgi:general secretion pathway protein G